MLRRFFRIYLSLFCTATLAFLAGCESYDPRLSGDTQYLGGVYGDEAVSLSAPRDTVSYWDGDSIAGKPSVKISLAEQRAYFYKSGQLVGISQLSTGREGLATPVGQFRISQKDIDHVSSKYGDYVDAANNVIVAKRRCRKRSETCRNAFQRRAHALFYAHRRRRWHARRLFAGLPCLARLYSDAGIHGGEFFQIRFIRNACNDHALKDMPAGGSRLAFESARPHSRLSFVGP